jgi:ankyrin repeat protein
MTIRNENGRTPLAAAVAWSVRKDIVEMMIARGADVNAKGGFREPSPPDYKTDEGWTPLHTACWKMNQPWRADYENAKAVVEMLVANGADVNAKTKNGRTPMSLLKWGGREENEQTVELLRKHGAKE